MDRMRIVIEGEKIMTAADEELCFDMTVKMIKLVKDLEPGMAVAILLTAVAALSCQGMNTDENTLFYNKLTENFSTLLKKTRGN